MSEYKLFSSILQMKGSSVFFFILLQSPVITFYDVHIYDDGYYILCHVFSRLSVHIQTKEGEFLLSLWIFFAAFVFFLYGKIFDAYFQSAVQHTRHFNPETNGSCVTKSLGGMEIAAINVSLIHLAV